MITETRGNLLDADVDALVNTVNTVGVMGKGIALQFKQAYPSMFRSYSRAVRAGEVHLGRMHVWPTEQLSGPRYIINFPTKGHWRANSRMSDIVTGLDDLIRIVGDLGIASIAMPPVGCGNGGLAWEDVGPLIREAFARVPNIDVQLFPPGATPKAKQMRVATRKPGITAARAALIHLLHRYTECALEASLIETQKLLYFLQVSGEPLRLQYVKGRYGPYADNLRHTLLSLEGHYLLGFGDGSSKVMDAEPIRVLPGADQEALPVLADHPETQSRIARVLDLVEGFESAYGLELLATVHWLYAQMPTSAGPEQVAEAVKTWSPRKGEMFTLRHVRTAWNALAEQGWLAQT